MAYDDEDFLPGDDEYYESEEYLGELDDADAFIDDFNKHLEELWQQ